MLMIVAAVVSGAVFVYLNCRVVLNLSTRNCITAPPPLGMGILRIGAELSERSE